MLIPNYIVQRIRERYLPYHYSLNTRNYMRGMSDVMGKGILCSI